MNCCLHAPVLIPTPSEQTRHDLALHHLNLSQCVVYFDFDNTIAEIDVLDGIIERFSINDEWVAHEQAWKEGRIGSRECMENQLRGIRVSERELFAYLDTIGIDSGTGRLLALFRAAGVEPVIISDGFDLVISRILANHGIQGMNVYANQLTIRGDRLLSAFPRAGGPCTQCAHCKTSTLGLNAFDARMLLYIGDGRSDICPARYADIVFAKRGYSLERYFCDTGRRYISFNCLSDICNQLNTATA